MQIIPIRETLLESVRNPKYRPNCRFVLDDYFELKDRIENPSKGFLQNIFRELKSASREIEKLGLDDMVKLYEFCLQDPKEKFSNAGFLGRIPLIKSFIHVRGILTPLVIIRENLITKRIKLRKHRQIVSP